MTSGIDHIALSVGDLDAQVRFYTQALGTRPESDVLTLAEGVARVLTLHGADGLRLELVQRAGSTPSGPAGPLGAALVQGYFHWALRTADLHGSLVALQTAGATLVAGPANAATPGTRFAYVTDPESNLIELVQRDSDRAPYHRP